MVVTFAIDTFSVNASAGPNGAVSPDTQSIDYGSSASINITPDAGYHIATILDNGSSQPAANPYVISNVQADHTVVVTFAIDTFTITASASGGHGTVAPDSQVLNYGSDASINITPDTGYHIATILDNGASQPAANPYVISNVQADHTVVVTFAIDTFTVAASAGSKGSVSPASQVVDYGSSASINITPDAGYHIETITDTGTPQAIINPYVISNVQADHNVVVTFAIDTFAITASAGANGSVSPTSQDVDYGSSAQINITPDAGYHIASISDNGASQPINNPYVISNVQAAHNVIVTFATDSYTISASPQPQGAGTITGQGTYNYGETVNLVASPAVGYHFVNWTEGGIEISTNITYSFVAQANRSLTANFVIDSFTISASVSGGHGGLNPASQVIGYGSSASINITPDAGYHIASISDNGASQPAANPYVISNVQADHTVVVTFAIGAFTITASVSQGSGSVNPASQVVEYGSTAQIDITAGAGYHISSIVDNGTAQPIANPYVINNVAADHNISVVFSLPAFNVNASVEGGHGSVTPASQSVDEGTTAAIDITPDAHYHIASISDNGITQPVTDHYVIPNIAADHSISVTFAIGNHLVMASAGSEGSISPAGQLTVNDGDTLSFNITPNSGFAVQNVWVDSVNIGAVSKYTFKDIGSDHIIAASFEPATHAYSVTATVSGGHGRVVAPSGTVKPGDTVSIDLVPDLGYRVGTITDNGVSRPANDPYVLTNVQEGHNIVVTFAEIAFYFAEGYTGPGFQEYLCLGQPGDTPLDVHVTYLFSGDPSIEKTYTVPATSRITINVNSEVGAGKEVSIKCRADYPFVSERPMYFSYTGGGSAWTGGHDAVGASLPSTTWYFAEGYTGPGFDEWICVLNPSDAPANLTFNFQTQEAGEKKVSGLSVAAHSRGSFKANDLLGGQSFQTSLKLESSQPVVAERAMYFSYQGTNSWNWTGGHDVMGAPALSRDYYLPEGTTRSSFEEWLTIQNPNDSPIIVNATYLLASGAPVEKEYTINASQRFTVYVPAEVGPNQDVSVHLSSASDFLAERPMYFNYQGMGGWGWTGGHCVIGATSFGQKWFFAEGYTGSGFEEWICIQNPQGQSANVTITYYPEGGAAPIITQHVVPANSRYTVLVNRDAGANRSVSAQVSSDQPIICERPMYFTFNGVWTGGHDVVGYQP